MQLTAQNPLSTISNSFALVSCWVYYLYALELVTESSWCHCSKIKIAFAQLLLRRSWDTHLNNRLLFCSYWLRQCCKYTMFSPFNIAHDQMFAYFVAYRKRYFAFRWTNKATATNCCNSCMAKQTIRMEYVYWPCKNRIKENYHKTSNKLIWPSKSTWNSSFCSFFWFGRIQIYCLVSRLWCQMIDAKCAQHWTGSLFWRKNWEKTNLNVNTSRCFSLCEMCPCVFFSIF